jgi:RND family efflux transporter MFP subunit
MTFFILLLGTALAGCDPVASETGDTAGKPGGDRVSANAGAPARVVVQRPTPTEGTQNLVLPGSVESWEVAPLYARVTGYLESVSVDIGDPVPSGAVLARIEVPEMGADLRSAAAKLTQEQAELELARLTRTRLERLRQANREAISQQDVDAAAAKERIEAAQVAVARAAYDRVRTLGDYARLKAPFAGRITKRYLHPGALAREGTSSGAEPIVEIARTDRLRLAFEVPETLAPWVRVGAPVKVRFDAFPGVETETVIARLAGSLDPDTRSMRAEVDLENPEGRYQPGLYASLQIGVERLDGALNVPSRAVRGQGKERYCLVARDGVLHRQPVVVAWDDGHHAVIARGLGRDDRVMVAGSPLAREGMRCDPVEEQPQ